MTRRAAVVILAAILLGWGHPFLFAISVKTVNLPEMVEGSNRVFFGRCLSAEDVYDPDLGFAIREYRFRVLENLKGASEGEIVVFRQVGSGVGPVSIPGMPQYLKGQETLLFLYAESRLGLTSPVGLEQGLFRAERLETGELGFVNGYGNRNLAADLEEPTIAAAGLSAEETRVLRSDSPIPLSALRSLVAKFDGLASPSAGVDR